MGLLSKLSDTTGQNSGSDESSKGGATPIFDKLKKWNDNRKATAGLAKVQAGGADLAGIMADPQSAKKGGLVKKTGLAQIHEGERILTKAQAKKYDEEKSKPKKSAKKSAPKKAGPRKRA